MEWQQLDAQVARDPVVLQHEAPAAEPDMLVSGALQAEVSTCGWVVLLHCGMHSSFHPPPSIHNQDCASCFMMAGFRQADSGLLPSTNELFQPLS